MGTRVSKPPQSRRVRRELAYSDTDLTHDTGTRLLLRAARHEMKGDYPEALAIYDKVAQLEELASLSLARKAKVQREQGDLGGAAYSLTRALHYCVNDPDRSHALYTELGDIHAQLGDYEEASYHYRRALVLAPNKVEVQRRLRGALHLRYCARSA